MEKTKEIMVFLFLLRPNPDFNLLLLPHQRHTDDVHHATSQARDFWITADFSKKGLKLSFMNYGIMKGEESVNILNYAQF